MHRFERSSNKICYVYVLLSKKGGELQPPLATSLFELWGILGFSLMFPRDPCGAGLRGSEKPTYSFTVCGVGVCVWCVKAYVLFYCVCVCVWCVCVVV
jgi:hypothetical protein